MRSGTNVCEWGRLTVAKSDDFEWDDTLGWMLKRPLSEYAIPPTATWEREAASIICGHAFIQRLSEEEHAEFEMFIRRVIQTKRPS
jgi:hypothetical protein